MRQIEIQLDNPVKEYEVYLHSDIQKEVVITEVINVGNVFIYDLVKLSDIYGNELYPQIFYLQTGADALLYVSVIDVLILRRIDALILRDLDSMSFQDIEDLNGGNIALKLLSSEISTNNTIGLDLSDSELNAVLSQIIGDIYTSSIVNPQASIFHLSSNTDFVFMVMFLPVGNVSNLGTSVNKDTALTVYMSFLDCGVVRYDNCSLSELDNSLLSSLDSKYESMSLRGNVLDTYLAKDVLPQSNDITLESNVNSVDITTLIKDNSTFNMSLEDITQFDYESIFNLHRQISHLILSNALTISSLISTNSSVSHLQTGLEYRASLYEIDYQSLGALDGSLICNVDGDLGVLKLSVYVNINNDISIGSECTIALYNGFTYYDDMLLSEMDDQYLYVLEAEK